MVMHSPFLNSHQDIKSANVLPWLEMHSLFGIFCEGTTSVKKFAGRNFRSAFPFLYSAPKRRKCEWFRRNLRPKGSRMLVVRQWGWPTHALYGPKCKTRLVSITLVCAISFRQILRSPALYATWSRKCSLEGSYSLSLDYCHRWAQESLNHFL